MSSPYIRFVLCATVLLATCSAAPTKLTATATDSTGRSLGAVVVFDGLLAFEYGESIKGAPLASYDLTASSWTDQSGQKVSLEQAREWAASSKQRALASLAKVTDPGQKTFTEMLLNPVFKVASDDKQIRLDSEYLSYVATEALPTTTAVRQAYFAYDELNAYRKAMVQRRTPPFPQLAVSGILRDRAMVPGRLTMELRTPNGEIQVTTALRWEPLTAEELAEFQSHRS